MGSLNLTLKYTIFYFAATSGFSDTEVLSIVSKFWILSTLKWKWKLFLKITLTAYVIFFFPLSFKFHVAVGEDGLDWEENVNFMPVFSGLEWMRTGWNCVWEQVGIMEGSFSVWYSCGENRWEYWRVILVSGTRVVFSWWSALTACPLGCWCQWHFWVPVLIVMDLPFVLPRRAPSLWILNSLEQVWLRTAFDEAPTFSHCDLRRVSG